MSLPAHTAAAHELPEPLDVIETPTSPSSGLALSRFEFETGKGNDGTKILMVEWDASVASSRPEISDLEQESTNNTTNSSSDWEVSWEGKATVLPIRDADPGSTTRRVYFLLPPGAPIPALVSIAYKGGTSSTDTTSSIQTRLLRTKPMPAIFPAELTGGEQAGRRGVLHTIWAKKRLAELQSEIAAEMKANGESVGLEMAMQERQWIVDHFGLNPDHGSGPKPTRLHIPQSPTSPTSPRSPIGGRLGEKLRGLKLATSPAELAAATQVAKSAHPTITSLSPSTSDVAVSSYASFGNRTTAPTAASVGGVASLDAIIGSGLSTAGNGGEATTEEDLFALPMSPRSPEMKRSPFSLI